MHIMDLPQMKREKDYLKWADEIKDLIKVVEETTGNKVTAEALAENIRKINAKRAALERLYKLRRNECVPISGTDVLLISQIAYYDDPERFATMVNKLCDELDKRVADGVNLAEGKKRILISGTPMAIPNWKMHNLVETSGGIVVCEETCTGTRYFENYVDESGKDLDEMVQNIANRYMGINCACFTPNTARFDDVVRLAKDSKADGVVDVSLIARLTTSRAEASKRDARLRASRSSASRQTTLTAMLSSSRQGSAHSSKCSDKMNCPDDLHNVTIWGRSISAPHF